MSYIDCYDHKVLGNVMGIEVYQALQDINGEDFQCKEGQIIIGGGGGEHPALVIKDISSAVEINILYIYDNAEYDESDEYSGEGFHPFDNLSFFFWTIENYVNIDKNIRKEGYSTDGEVHSIEVWINILISNFIIEKYPELIDKDLLKHYKTIRQYA